jgi:hypothetical protein
MRWTYEQLDRETLDFIAGLPQSRVVKLDGTAPSQPFAGLST